MNNFFLTISFLAFCLIAKAQTGIGTSSPAASAKLEVNSSTQGFLPPRIALTGTNDNSTIKNAAGTSITPATGLLVYNTTVAGTSPNNVTPGFYYYNGSNWIRLINPNDNANNISGILAVANGGTGVTTSTGSGSNVLSQSPTIETLTVSSGNGQYPSSINVLPTTHATSRRAGLWLGDWGVLQDLNGVGTKNFSITQSVSGTYPSRLLISTDGKIGMGSILPTTALHIENGNSIGGGDPGNNIVPSIYVYNNNNTSSTANSIIAVRTAGSGGGKPFLSFDANGFAGYSIGLNNPTDQLVFNTNWNFNTSTGSNNALIINRSGQNRVIVPSSAGAYVTDWPSGWGGGLATFDFSCAGIYYSSLSARSDIRLKNTINNLTKDIVSKYLSLRPVSYYWNNDKSSDKNLQYGFIAQEVEELFPEMVNTATDSMQTKSLNYQSLHAISLKVIQVQQEDINLLKKKQAELEERLLKLEAKFH